MKHISCVLLSIALLLSLAGCRSREENMVSFYYCRSLEDYQYFEEDGVIRAESRELTSHRNDLRYMLGLYLAGPLEAGLESPFSPKAKLLDVQKADNTIQIELSDQKNSLTDSEFSLACACLTLTCMSFSPCNEVTVISGERTITMNADSIMLFDTLPMQETSGG